MILHTSFVLRVWILVLGVGASSIFLQVISTPSVRAQVATAITSDGSLPTPTNVLTDGSGIFTIGDGTIRGSNLFHSLDQFQVGTGDTASFVGPGNISNILSRVTGLQSGLQASVIDGTIQSLIPGANLYLMNPAGIIFGSNGSLDIGATVGQPGSFYATTADYLSLVGGGSFDGIPNSEADALLSSAPVEAFGFLNQNPAPISIDFNFGGIQVPLGNTPDTATGQTLGLIGGDISVTSSIIFVPSGQLQLASVGSPGEILASTLEPRPNVAGDAFSSMGNIAVSSSSLLDVSDQNFFFGGSAGDGHGGAVVIRSGQLMLQDSSVINSSTFGNVDGDSKGIDLRIETLSLESGGTIQSNSQGSGKGVEINVRGINSSSVNVIGQDLLGTRSSIKSTSLADGVGGMLTVESQSINLQGGSLESETFSNGDGGHILLKVDSFNSTDGGLVESRTSGLKPAGDITIQGVDRGTSAPSVVQLAGVDANGNRSAIRTFSFLGAEGSSGNILVTGNSISLTEGAQIRGQNNGNAAQGGSITLSADEALVISGEDSIGAPSGILNYSTTTTNGIAGPILISGNSLSLTDGAEIQSGSIVDGPGGPVTVSVDNSLTISNSAGISSLATNQDVGVLTVSAPNLTIDNGFLRANTIDSGNAGDILVDGESVLLMNQGRIDSATSGSGRGGNIIISATQLALQSGSTVFASTTGAGDAGTATLLATESILIEGSDAATGFDSSVSSSSSGIGANAGEVTLRAPTITLADRGFISTSAELFTGRAGNVLLEGETVSLSGGARVTSSTRSDQPGGMVTIDTTDAVIIEGNDGQGNVSRVATVSDFDLFGFAGGDAGEVSIATNSFRVSGGEISVTTASAGDAGKVTVSAQNVQLDGGAFIVSDTLGEGSAGTVTVTARGSFSAEGTDPATNSVTRISSSTAGLGNAGVVTISAPTLNLGNSAEVTTRTFGDGDAGAIRVSGHQVQVANGAAVDSSTLGTGNGGSIRVTGSESITIIGENQDNVGSSITAISLNNFVATPGSSGSIALEAPKISLIDGASVSTISQGPGNAGDINATAPDTIFLQDSRINTSANQASGGNIKLDAINLIHLVNSTIEANVLGDVDTVGGNINLDPEAIVLQNSRLTTTATLGAGGNIDLIGNTVLVDPLSNIDASSDFGISGSVTIDAAIQNLSGTIAPLPETIIQTTTLYAAQCAAQKDGAFSSLNVRGRDRIPSEPGDYLLTPMLLSSARNAVTSKTPFSPARRLGMLVVKSSTYPSVALFSRGDISNTNWLGECGS